MDAYQISREKEISQFKELKNIHDLPDIYHYWSNKYLLPNLVSSGFSSIDDFYAKSLLNSMNSAQRFLSIGAGYCDTEIRIAKLMRQRGLNSFKFECLEINPDLLSRGRELAKEEGLEDTMIFTEADFNFWEPTAKYFGVMANHSLHHVVNLEGLFRNIKKSLHENANFVTSDIVGRNGHLRWPEARVIIEQLWSEIPDSYRFNHQLKRHESLFEDWDCSNEGFEGVRSQDILPLLLENFYFRFFYGFCNVISPFIDRGFGHNFDLKNDWDKSFIDRVHAIDEAGFLDGSLKPTQILAVMSKSQALHPTYVRGISPVFAVRLK